MEVAPKSTPKENDEDILTDEKAEEKEKTPSPPIPDQPKKSKKEEKSTRKDDKSVEQFMKSLNSVPSLEEKLSLVCKKYVQMAEDNKKMQFYIKQSDKRYALLLKEKDQLQHEYNKTVLVKSKLENLCRELQKQNKAIKEESLLKIREEEERRKETQAKFQSTLSEITALLQQNNDKNAKLRDDNISMSDKFKSVLSQYQLREQQVDKMAKQMALESQLADAKMQKASLEHQAERGRLLAEMETLKMEAAQCHAKIQELQATEVALRSQINVYTDKYDEFQNALVKSNQVFGGFKGEMEKMSKKIHKLEKESLSWKRRWESSQAALIDMCSERQASEERAAAAGNHLHHMQGLCRTLQAERTLLLNTLKENNIERPPLPTPPPATAPPPPPAASTASNAKVDAMAANCVQLKQSLAHLQSQLNILTNNKKDQPKEEPPKQEKKKSKSKKNKSEKIAQESVQENADIQTSEATVENELNANGNNEENAMENLCKAVTEVNVTDDAKVNGDGNKNLDSAVTVATNVENVAVKVDVAPVKVDNVPVKDDNATVNVDNALVNLDSVPKNAESLVEVNVAPVKVDNVPVKNENTAVKVDNALENFENSIKGDLESSFVDPSSNDEVSHIPEIKSILDNKTEIAS